MNLLTRKLEGLARLDDADRRLLDEVASKVRDVPAGADVIREGDRPDDVHLVLEGFACRYKITESGLRHIMAYLLPGDFCDLHVAILGEMDHSIGTLAPSRMVELPKASINRLLERPAIAKALWWATLVDEAILREWLVNMGTRDAATALAHLFCELLVRLRAVGLAEHNSFHLPLTQQDLSDTAGISVVHTNRALQTLRQQGLVKLERRRLTVLDPPRLFERSSFNPNYLHNERADSAEPVHVISQAG